MGGKWRDLTVETLVLMLSSIVVVVGDKTGSRNPDASRPQARGPARSPFPIRRRVAERCRRDRLRCS